MNQKEIDNIKVGDILRIKDPKSPAAKQLREKILKIEEFYAPHKIRVVTSIHFDGYSWSEEGKYELNQNLYGKMEVI